jgi:UDP-N-acetylglucosamine--N-acetylmuramyl-(pentapeptide) pyrophosphoryl-undecaprenol N-acetylglucosamine transferase
MRVIISGGGTGGHIFPALSIAEALKKRFPNVEILFVGAENRMEMEKIPAAGYPIIGLPVAGFDRKNLLRNIDVLIKLQKSLHLAKNTLKDFRPDIAIGVGGYASGPTLKMASKLGIPTLIQEQNSYAGVTNKLLAKKASKICVAYDGMERFFPEEKIVLTGNPVRQNLLAKVEDKLAAYAFFGLDPDKKTILVVGGSLGARTINNSIMGDMDKLAKSDVQVLWQSGKIYHEALKKKLEEKGNPANIHLNDFISRMDLAYAVADLVVSRAGAGSISELCLLRKAAILVPSPNVAEDHQTKNALALVNKEAAILVKDVEAEQKLADEALKDVQDTRLLEKLSAHVGKLALPDSAEHIVDEIVKIVGANRR